MFRSWCHAISNLCPFSQKIRTFSHLPNWWAVFMRAMQRGQARKRPLLKKKCFKCSLTKTVSLTTTFDPTLAGPPVWQCVVCPRKFGGPYASDSPIPRRTRGLLPPPLSKRPWGMQPRSDKRTRAAKRPGLRGTSDTWYQDTLRPQQCHTKLGTKCLKMFSVLWLQSSRRSDWSNPLAFTWCFDGKRRFHSPLSGLLESRLLLIAPSLLREICFSSMASKTLLRILCQGHFLSLTIRENRIHWIFVTKRKLVGLFLVENWLQSVVSCLQYHASIVPFSTWSAFNN